MFMCFNEAFVNQGRWREGRRRRGGRNGGGSPFIENN